MTSDEIYKASFYDNQVWNQQILISTPFSEGIVSNSDGVYPLQFNLNEKRVRNSTYSPSTTSTSSSSSSSFSIDQELKYNLLQKKSKDIQFDKQKQRRLRFDIVLEAATAVTQKAEESTITYLNRGQMYGIQLTDKHGLNETITSTLSIDFHLASHRMVAESYWKFWVNQQKYPESRTIDIDSSQSTGITHLHFPSFNKLTFKWNGKYGAKIYVRFKCLSTDFSRIKGVKGIPLRAQMESQIENENEDTFNEISFCKVKLFRDKGAERKNKDDAKQISKQLEKVYGKATEQSLPLLYNASLPFSVFSEIPANSSLGAFDHAVDEYTLPLFSKKTARYHTRVMTAPTFLFDRNHNNKKVKLNSLSPLSTISPEFLFDSNNSPSYTRQDTVYSPFPSPMSSPTSTTPLKHEGALKIEEELNLYNCLYETKQQGLSSIDTPTASLGDVVDSVSLLIEEGVNSQEQIVTSSLDSNVSQISTGTALYASNAPQSMDYICRDSIVDLESNPYNLLTPDLTMDGCWATTNLCYNAQQTVPLNLCTSSTSIYDVFTPEEISQPLGTFSFQQEALMQSSFLPNSQYPKDYFCTIDTNNTYPNIAALQEQIHNKSTNQASLNNNSISNMFHFSLPDDDDEILSIKRKKSKNSYPLEGVLDQTLPYSVNLNCSISPNIDSNNYSLLNTKKRPLP